MSLKTCLRNHLLFSMYCSSILVILILNACKGYLLTNTKSDQRLDLDKFKLGYGITDELLLLLKFERLARLHLKHNSLAFNRGNNSLAFGLIFGYHFFVFAPLHLRLNSGSAVLNLYIVCYNIQLFFVSVGVLVYVQGVLEFRRHTKEVLNQDPDSDVAFIFHENHRVCFKNFNSDYGLFLSYVLVHTVITASIQANIILMYVFNDAYQLPGMGTRLLYLLNWLLLGPVKLTAICVASDLALGTWLAFERKLRGSGHQLRGLLLQTNFVAGKSFLVDNRLIFMVMYREGSSACATV